MMTAPIPHIPVLTLVLAGGADSVQSVMGHWSPLPVEQLLLGRDTANVNALLNTMLVLCRHAQSAASAHALAAAQSARVSLIVHNDPVELEAARETLRRWLMDFPTVFGGDWSSPVIAQWARLDSRERVADFCSTHVFGLSASAWLVLSKPELRQWARNVTTLPARWLRDLLEHARRPVDVAPADVLRYVDKNAMALLTEAGQSEAWPAHAALWDEPERAPDLASALLFMRLRRLARFCAGPEHRASATTGSLRHGNIGIGWARCARGVLVHLARVRNGKVAAYRIITPTRWNFGPTNLLQHALRGLSWDAAQPLAQRLALLLDPCTPYRIEVANHA